MTPSPDPHRCFSRSGWWQTLCGRDAANQGFGWSSDPARVGCAECQEAIHQHVHLSRPVGQYLKTPIKQESRS